MAAEAKQSSEKTISVENLKRLQVLERAAREVLQKYRAAMRQMEVRLEILDEDMRFKHMRSPIHQIETRLKSFPSILEKLQRYGKRATVEDMTNYVMDIAGVRVICSYIQDVYNLYERLKLQDDLKIINVKDYIACPKANGYRSLHIIAKIPVYFSDEKEEIPVEIQLRTVAMDFWASLEHDLKYKAVREIKGIDTTEELRECSKIIEDVEARMQVLAHALEAE